MANKPENLKPFKKGTGKNKDPRIGNKPKGAKSFKTIFEAAAKEVAKALRLGEKPDAVQIELVKKGIRKGLKGDYSFFRDLMDRRYGRAPEKLDVTSGGKPLSLLSNVRSNHSNQETTETEEEN